MAENGRLPQSSLRPIAGGGYLTPEAAAAWNAMAAHIFDETGIRIAPKGSDSSYRSYDRQVYWRNYWCSQGACENAAVPGTSNHGWGLAVDTAYDAVINQYGAPFGWQKAWSDASWEPWHFKHAAGHYSGPDPGPDYTGKPDRDPTPTLRKGDKGRAVKKAQVRLQVWNRGVAFPSRADGEFGDRTAASVRDFQLIHDLKPVDGVVGDKTWKVLLRNDVLEIDERTAVNRIRLLRAGDNRTDAEKAQIKRLSESIAKMARKIAEVAKKDGWGGNDKRDRHRILRANV